MTPHQKDDLKLIRGDIEELKFDVSGINMHLRRHDDEFKLVRADLKDISKQFDQQDKNLSLWKNQLFTKIDKFLGRIDKQDKEIAAIAFRKDEHETRILKLESSASLL